MAPMLDSDSEARPRLESRPGALASIGFHARTLWLFSRSDLKTIVIPSTLFGCTNALAADRLGIAIGKADHEAHVLTRTPLALVWVWANFLPFAINNQLGPRSMAEDAINKPFRPLPSRRITPGHARVAMVGLYAAAALLSTLFIGGGGQSMALLGLGVWYNNLGGADGRPLVRNGLNALGYVSFASGAMDVALGAPPEPPPRRLLAWFAMLAAVVATTVHAQDMFDQEGDAARGRRTVPLVVGDGPARWMLAAWMVVWGVCCPRFWGSSWAVAAVGLGGAAVVAGRTLVLRGVASDRGTFVVWNVWLCLLYALPLCGQSQ